MRIKNVMETLGEFDPTQVDMFTLVLVGNSQSYAIGGGIATPRGYTAGHDGQADNTEIPAVDEKSKLYPISLVGLENSSMSARDPACFGWHRGRARIRESSRGRIDGQIAVRSSTISVVVHVYWRDMHCSLCAGCAA